jgi:hypothetical protein
LQRAEKLPWPKTLAERVMAVSAAMAEVKEQATAAALAKRLARARAADVGEILETLCAVGKARRGKVEGTYLPLLLLNPEVFGRGGLGARFTGRA